MISVAPKPPATKGTQRSRIRLWIALSIGVVMACELLSFFGGNVLERAVPGLDLKTTWQIYDEQRRQVMEQLRHRDTSNDMFHPALGWVYRPNYRGSLYSNNSAGMRGRKEYALHPADSITRMAAFGDSFVYGSEVGDEQVWTHRLEALWGNVEVLNFGVGGYGTDQAYLRYRLQGEAYRPHVVLIGFAPIDLARNVNVFQRFISSDNLVHFKPRYQLEGEGELALIETPVQSEDGLFAYHEDPQLITRVGENDYFYNPLVYENPLYNFSATVRVGAQLFEVLRRRLSRDARLYEGGRFNTESEAFRVTTAILLRFANAVTEQGAVPVIVMFPAVDTLQEKRRGKDISYGPLIDALERKGVEVLDLSDAFVGEVVTRGRHFMPGLHYSPHSNCLIARYLGAYLWAKGFVEREPQGSGCGESV